MSTFHIKIIAIVTMIIDHIGLFFFPQIEIFRIIGRIAFPLFAWLIANGAYHTRDIKSYLSRLFYLALISQVPFTLANQQIGTSLLYLNVVFTLYLGLLAIYLIKNTKNKFLWPIIILGCSVVADFIQSDYGAMGVLSVVTFYLFLNSKIKTAISQIILLFVLPLFISILEIYNKTSFSYLYINSLLEVYGLIALVFIFLYKNIEGRKAKYLFYIVYPLQYIVIYLVRLAL